MSCIQWHDYFPISYGWNQITFQYRSSRQMASIGTPSQAIFAGDWRQGMLDRLEKHDFLARDPAAQSSGG